MFLMPWQRSIHMLKSIEFKQWIQKCSLRMVNSAVLIPKSRVSIALWANELVENILIAVFLQLKSVGKAYQLEANHLREGILTRKYRTKMSSF